MSDACPGGGSKPFKNNGPLLNGTQNQQGQAYGRQLVLPAEHSVMAEAHRPLAARLVREHLSLQGICRAVGVGITGLTHLRADCFNTAPAP
jgi:hypothetical protein